MSENTNATLNISWGMVLFIVFLILKLTHVIDWSWWWVTSPLWIGAALVLIGIPIFMFIYHLIDRWTDRW